MQEKRTFQPGSGTGPPHYALGIIAGPSPGPVRNIFSIMRSNGSSAELREHPSSLRVRRIGTVRSRSTSGVGYGAGIQFAVEISLVSTKEKVVRALRLAAFARTWRPSARKALRSLHSNYRFE